MTVIEFKHFLIFIFFLLNRTDLRQELELIGFDDKVISLQNAAGANEEQFYADVLKIENKFGKNIFNMNFDIFFFYFLSIIAFFC
jgi:hypothetical protein